MKERKSDNNNQLKIPSAFVEAFPDEFPRKGDFIPETEPGIAGLVGAINREFITKMLRRARMEMINA